MASPQTRTTGTTNARTGQGPHPSRIGRTTRVFPGSGSVRTELSLSSPKMPSRGLSRRRAGSRYRRCVSVNKTKDLPGSASRTNVVGRSWRPVGHDVAYARILPAGSDPLVGADVIADRFL